MRNADSENEATNATSMGPACEAIVAAVRIDSPTRFSLADGPVMETTPFPVLPVGFESHPELTSLEPLTCWLWAALYQHCYCRPFHGAPFCGFDSPPSADPAFVDTLESADQGRKPWDDGWKVYQVSTSGDVFVEKGERRRTLSQAVVLKTNPHLAAVRPGQLVALPIRRAPAVAQPEFCFAFGDWLGDQVDEYDVLRFYIHAGSRSAPAIVRALTAELNRRLVPFRLKCMTDPRSYARTDATVLYVPSRYVQAVAPVVVGLPFRPGIELLPDVPLFTKRIAAGIGLAEDPHGGESFGMHRCRGLAQGLVDAWKSGQQTPNERMRSVRQAFQQLGIDPDRPSLNAGSSDWYELPKPESGRNQRPAQHTSAVAVDVDVARGRERNSQWLEVADRIGCRLCRDAIWAGDRCNWLGWTVRKHSGGPQLVYEACGTDLYDGTAGIALFLTRLFRFTNDATQRDTAVAALRQAQLRLGGDEVIGPGFYSGAAGLAFAEMQAGETLGDERFLQQGVDRLEAITRMPPAKHSADVTSGIAGLIPLLINVGTSRSIASFVEYAVDCGEHLLQSACRDESGWSWETSRRPMQRNLCGYASGAAGIACALLETYAVSRDERFLEAALEAFRYERSCFHPVRGNWPDFRTADDAVSPATPAFPIAWCRGAAGMGFGRFRADRLLREVGSEPQFLDAVRSEIEVAIDTTAADLRSADAAERSFCLCHGLAGHADLLLLAASEWNQPELRARAEQVGGDGMRHCHATELPWRCGVADGREVPGLMLGLAGIGHFYLRLYDDQAVPTVLLAGEWMRDEG